MTTGLKNPSSYYIELITTFPPRPITNENELKATQNRINSILDKDNITQDDRDYLKVLSTLVYDYENQHEIIPTLTGIALIKALLEESSLQPQDLIPIYKSESRVLDILNGKAESTPSEIQGLADLFKMSPKYFIE
ncbi:transcription regulator with HTH domain protein [Calothrix parasitica NIES-267]|uniref:Transcription regulator with HTH domain protein n=1 Tax=Calothrix parasitica NIES-267 TaxID=1973488 RepID=A0A1Z4LSE5_9CYAN|nr:transcription regulator with HTH domain protein [Calothrix parasitica NIES-267]